MARQANLLDQLLHLERRRGSEATDGHRDREVEQHSDRSNTLRTDAEQPAFSASLGNYETEPDDVGRREDDAGQHASDGALLGRAFAEDAENQDRKET